MVDRLTIKERLRASVASRDANRVAAVFELPPISPVKSETPKRQHHENLQDGSVDWSVVLSSLLDAHEAAEAGHALQCYEAQAALHASFNLIFGSSQGNWLVPALRVVCRNTHHSAVGADSEGTGRKDHAKLQNAVTLLQESYSKTFNDRKDLIPNAPFNEDGSKKAGVLYIVNQLFAIYFRLNTLRLCKNLLRPVESRGLHEQGTKGEMVTYRYFVGRLNMFEDQYEAAEQHLDYAFLHCHKHAFANKKFILRYLVPVKIYRGRLPSPKLLEKYSLTEFLPLVEGIRRGDLRTFNDGLIRYQDIFIRQGTYLLLEKCKTVCYRNLFLRVHKILGTTRIPLDQVATTFKWLGMPIDLDEVECILANLIFRGYVRGYLSHTKRVLVLSSRDPFPTSVVVMK